MSGFRSRLKVFFISGTALVVAFSSFLFSSTNRVHQFSFAKNNDVSIKDSVPAEDSLAKSLSFRLKNDSLATKVNKLVFANLRRPEMIDDLADSIRATDSEIVIINRTKPIEPKKVCDKCHRFNIDFFPEDFPELAGYEAMFFEIDESRFVYNDSIYDKVYDNLVLTRADGIDDYSVELYWKSNTMKLFAYPVFENWAFGAAMKIFEKKFAYYQKQLQAALKRKENFQKKYNKILKEWKKELSEFYLQLRTNGRKLY